VSERHHRQRIQSEFERAAKTFVERTKGRFDDLGIVEFARVSPHDTVLEVGAGTGNFLQLFQGSAAELVAVDVTKGMLLEARRQFPGMRVVVADGARLPMSPRSVDLVATAQALHHIWEPLPVLKEMRRVVKPEGRILVVDQIAPERYEEVMAMNTLELIRDPSHAAARPASVLRMLVRAAGLDSIDERIVEGEQRMSSWMWRGEFPDERIERVISYIDEHGDETGMNFRRDGGDYVFTRRRIMLLASRG
jgi:ubiquinone/menaquinone biosynthesis C-methylase UbiE